MIRFTPETGVHGVALVSQIARFADIIWVSLVCVYVSRDPNVFWKWAVVFLFFLSFFNHARRWSGWKERDSYLRSRRKP